jgi:uncharacterized protein YkwD
VSSRAQYVGSSLSFVGENIAGGYSDAEAVMSGWTGSAGHRTNILLPNYTETDVGIALNAQGRPYDFQFFGRPE